MLVSRLLVNWVKFANSSVEDSRRGHQNCGDRISAARLTPKNEFI